MRSKVHAPASLSTEWVRLFVEEWLLGWCSGCLAHCWVLREHALPWFLGEGFVCLGSGSSWRSYRRLSEDHGLAGVAPLQGDHGWLFENCTVDASIFVVKFLRAHGGCLGIRSR